MQIGCSPFGSEVAGAVARWTKIAALRRCLLRAREVTNEIIITYRTHRGKCALRYNILLHCKTSPHRDKNVECPLNHNDSLIRSRPYMAVEVTRVVRDFCVREKPAFIVVRRLSVDFLDSA